MNHRKINPQQQEQRQQQQWQHSNDSLSVPYLAKSSVVNRSSRRRHSHTASQGIKLVLKWCFVLSGLMLFWVSVWSNSSSIAQHHPPMLSSTTTTMAGDDRTFYLEEEETRNRTLLYSRGYHDRSTPLGTHPLRILLEKAGYSLQDKHLQSTLQLLPTWESLVELYGPKPIIVGLDTCQAFQHRPDPAEHMISVAGTFNTGTNLLAELIWSNCYLPARVKKYGVTSRGIRWQVPYGKHSPVDNETFRQHHKAGNEQEIATDNVLPIVAIRDPYYWMASMCRHPYQMQWPASPNHRCPNLVPNELDSPILQNIPSIPVRVEYGGGVQRMHRSMVHHFNEWYQPYLNASWPRVIVRYEDILFRPRQVIQAVCECAGGKLLGNLLEHPDSNNDNEEKKSNHNDDAQPLIPFYYSKESAKEGPFHGSHRTGLAEAMIQYTVRNRANNITLPDLAFAKQHLDPRIIKLFHYPTVTP